MTSTEAPASQDIVSVVSAYSVVETCQRLEAAIRERGLRLFARIDHSGEAERVGLHMQPAQLLIFGSPKAGTPLMIASPLLALDLPLKALVWQNDSGVWVSYNSTAYLASRHVLPDELVANIAGIDALIASALSAESGAGG